MWENAVVSHAVARRLAFNASRADRNSIILVDRPREEDIQPVKTRCEIPGRRRRHRHLPHYLATTVDLLGHGVQKSFWEYIVQYDSLIFLWIASAALIQLQSAKRAQKKEEESRRNVERMLDRQEIYGTLLKDIMMLLQDNVNNPLAII